MLRLPKKINELIGNEPYSCDNVGLSDSTVIIFMEKVLKIQRRGHESEHEYRVMKWLQGKLSVPHVLAYEEDEEKNYFLMSKLSGEMSCGEQYMTNPDQLVELLAEGLTLLWEVDIRDCAYKHGLAEKLEMAKYNVEHNLVDLDNVEAETFGENGFRNPEHLYEWLIANKPEEEFVFSHGDFAFPISSWKRGILQDLLIWERRESPINGKISHCAIGVCCIILMENIAVKSIQDFERKCYLRS